MRACPRTGCKWTGTSIPRPPPPGTPLDLPLPEDLDRLMASDPAAALALRLALRQALEQAFAQGLCITGYDPASRRYLLSPTP